MTILTTDQIFAAPDLAEEAIEIPEWGGSVKIRGISKAAQHEVRKAATVVRVIGGQPVEEVDELKAQMGLLVAGIVEPAFNFDQVAQLAEKASGPIDRIIKRVMVISGLSKEAVKEAEKSPST